MVTRSELSLSRRGEATFAVVWIRACAGGKDCSLDIGKMLRRTEENELVAYGTCNRLGGHFAQLCGNCTAGCCKEQKVRGCLHCTRSDIERERQGERQRDIRLLLHHVVTTDFTFVSRDLYKVPVKRCSELHVL